MNAEGAILGTKPLCGTIKPDTATLLLRENQLVEMWHIGGT
jgi:hypothetical protein